jgi:N-acetylneuraminate lyase
VYSERLVREGVTGVFCCGTSGESMSLTIPERKAALEAWLSTPLRVIVHIGTASLEQSKELAAHAEKVGAHGIALMPPFFFKPRNVEELVSYCESVAEAAPNTPLIYYHFPGMVGVNIPLYDFFAAASARIPTLQGAKFTDSQLGDFFRALCFADRKYDVMQGYEFSYLPCLALGAKGFVGVSFSLCAPVYLRLDQAFREGDFATAQRLQLAVSDFLTTVLSYSMIPAVKLLMKEWTGLDFGGVRKPLVSLTDEEKTKLLNDPTIKAMHALVLEYQPKL